MYCDICECDVPPRCWHCDTCDVCILTRDHHCAFSTTCVGHNNRRYFLWFLLYLSAASCYEIALIGYYAHCESVTIQLSDLMVLTPVQAVVNGLSVTVAQICVVVLALNFIAATMSTLLLVYHFDKMCKGLVCHEKHDGRVYDFGLVQNVKTVFGEKWYITWISPFVKSELPYNGLDWRNHISKKN